MVMSAKALKWRIQQFGDVKRRKEDYVSMRVMEMVVQGGHGGGRPKP